MVPSLRSPREAATPADSARMKKVRRNGTNAEEKMEAALVSRGVNFKHGSSDLIGKPDFVLPDERVAIFVDGCFWHMCKVHGALPRKNRAWWAARLAANKKRDRRVNRRLRAEGWSVFRIWEHEDPAVALWRLKRRLNQR